MPHYMVQAAYTSESWGTQVANPQNVIDRISPVMSQFGGKLESAYYAFGEYDAVLIGEFPDNTSAAAFSLAVTAGGAIKNFKTTPLMTVEEGMEAMRKAGGSGYRPPGA